MESLGVMRQFEIPVQKLADGVIISMMGVLASRKEIVQGALFVGRQQTMTWVPVPPPWTTLTQTVVYSVAGSAELALNFGMLSTVTCELIENWEAESGK